MTRALLECDIAPDRSNTTKDCCMKRFLFKRRLLPANIQTRICSTTIICHHGEKQRKTIRSKAPPLILITAELQVPSVKCERPQLRTVTPKQQRRRGALFWAKENAAGIPPRGSWTLKSLSFSRPATFFNFHRGAPC